MLTKRNMLSDKKLTNRYLFNSVWILCDNFKVNYLFIFIFSPSKTELSVMFVNLQNKYKQITSIFSTLQSFFHCFCSWHRSHRCLTGQIISQFLLTSLLAVCIFGLYGAIQILFYYYGQALSHSFANELWADKVTWPGVCKHSDNNVLLVVTI